MLATRVPLLLDLPADAWFDVALMHKDIRLALQQARGLRLMLPTATATDRELATADQLGYAHRDIAALHEVLDRLNPPARRDEPVGVG
jgi:3-hydroxyisobutyrate dehydrogenase-like beta-hydroxyacid dehydrogenase